MAIGRGVGVWTANEDTEFSNFSPAMQLENAQDSLTLVASKKPPYLLYGGIGLVVIIGAILIFKKK
jgi:hypothetical protein|tara:strand:- start:1741 stop:1938 length:198 start_codon:yes stop_codon:yes gene_type:complete